MVVALSQNVSTDNCSVQKLVNSLDHATLKDVPYDHYLLSDLCSPQLVDDLIKIPFDPIDLQYTCGSREEFNPVRRYLDPEIIGSYPAAKEFSSLFLSPEVISAIERIGNVCLKGSLLRIEYAIDTNQFWLKPHSDLGVKLVTILMYLSKDADAQGWGTDVFYDEEKYHSTVPYKTNTALMFYPSDKTWHGFNRRNISGIRKTLIINYVTPEWRNRQELVHPTNFVY